MTIAVDRSTLETLTPEELMAWTYRKYERVALVASFQAESVVLLHMATRIVPRPRVVTIDTGRLPEATHDYIESLRRRFGFDLEVLHPEPGEVAALVNMHGTNAFRKSVELRHQCCGVRKVVPLSRALQGYDAWITGIRRDQAETRRDVERLTVDRGHGGIAKLAPLALWTRADVLDYLAEHGIEPHPLYAEGFASIGCAPCTRAIAPGEDERAGRWWWESGADKECGLHWTAGE